MDVKRLLRPLVFRLRLLRGKLSRVVRPWAAWNGEHHPVLAQFPPWSGESDGTWVYDSLGVRTDPRFRFQFRPQPAGEVKTSHPAPHAQYFELVFVLDAIASAPKSRPFVMVELGAGYGTWLANVARAAQTAGIPDHASSPASNAATLYLQSPFLVSHSLSMPQTGKGVQDFLANSPSRAQKQRCARAARVSAFPPEGCVAQSSANRSVI